MTTVFSGSHYTDAAKEARFKPHPLLQLLIFVGIFFGAQFVMSVPLLLGVIPLTVMFGESDPYTFNMWYTVLSLWATVISAAVIIIWCRFVEKRSLKSMGLIKKNCAVHYLIGAALGFGAFSLVVLLGKLVGAVSYVGLDTDPNWVAFAFLCIGWLFQGAEEEIICRGYLMASLSARIPLWAASLINAVFFALLHLLNNGVTPLVMINLTLVGVLFSVLALRFDSLIPSCAMHSLWNLVQGNFFGLPVSGMETGPSVFRFTLSEDMDLWTGGEFGLEGGLAVTIVVTVMTAVVILLPKKDKEKAAA